MAQALVTRGQASLLCCLPPETIMSIAQLSSLSGHNNLSRTCQFLRFVLQPELFRHDGSLFAAMRFGCEKDSILPIQQALGFAFSPTVDQIFPDSNTMLGLAAFHGSVKVVRYLLSLNADTTHRGTDDLEPLGLALRGCFDAQPVPADPTDVTDSPKMKPCGVPYADVMQALLDAGANAHFRLPRYATIPDLRHDRECEMGLDEETLAPSNILSAIVDAHDYNRLTSEEAELLMRQFVTRGVSADRFSSTTLQTTLTFAVQQFCDGVGSFGLIELLLDNGADPRFTHLDHEVTTEWSALGAAIKNKNPQVVRYLLSRGAFPALIIDDPLEGDPIPPLWYAIHWSDEATIKALLEHGSSNPDYIGPDSNCGPVEYNDYQDEYCYHYLFAPLALVKAVVRQGASVHKEEVIRLLLLHGADPNLRNPDGRTPLIMALTLSKAFHRPYMVEVLLLNGADPNASSIKGVKPLEAATYDRIWDEGYTTESERLEIIDMLVKAGANHLKGDGVHTRANPLYIPLAGHSHYNGLKFVSKGYQDQLSDLKHVEQLYAQRLAQVNTNEYPDDPKPYDEPSMRLNLRHVMHNDAGYQWKNKLVPRLLMAGVGVSRLDLVEMSSDLAKRRTCTNTK